MYNWKSILLATGSFIDNEYLAAYIELIDSFHEVTSYMENHHIIPVAYYKQKYNVDTSKHRREAVRYANNDPDNKLVLLSFADHCKAHWLLTKCTVEELATSSATAFLRQIAGLKYINEKLFLNKNHHIVEVGLTTNEYEILQQQVHDIKTNNERFWSSEQDDWLRQNRCQYTAKYCAEYLGKTEKAVLCRCTALGIKRIWHTEASDAELLEYSKTHTAKECAEYFGVSKALIAKRWRELGFSKTFKWDAEKDNWLRENDNKYTVAEMAEKLGTTKTTIMGRRWTLGITRWDRTT